MNKKIKKLVYKQLDRIYSKSVRISKSFDQKAISPVTLRQCIDLSKIVKTDENKVIHEFIDHFNTMVDTLYNNCTEYMKLIGADKIAFVYLKAAILTLKKELVNLPS